MFSHLPENGDAVANAVDRTLLRNRTHCMKNALKFLQLHIAIAFVIAGFAPTVRAGLNPPYTNDFYTLHLWHLQDTNGTIAGVATNGVSFDDSAINPLVVPLEITNTPGGGNYDLAGEPGPGGPLVAIYGTNFGYDLSIQSTQSCGLYAPVMNAGGALYPSLSYAETNNSCSFVNTNTGAYTWEAVVQFNFNPFVASSIGDSSPEIISSDGGNSTPPGSNPYSVRANQFRIDVNTPANKNEAQFEWNGNITAVGSGASAMLHDVEAPIPEAGPDQFIQGNWYHLAVAFTGTAPTNGDPPDVLTMYWTPFSPSHTNADVLTNFFNFYTYTNTGKGTVYSLAYPSNSIIGTGVFDIGNDARGETGGWIGNIAEVRISDCYRHSNEFMFNDTFYPTPPIVNPLAPTNTLVGYGHNLTLNLQVVTATTPWVCQWFQVANGVTNLFAVETNSSSEVVSNITYAANTTTFFAVVTNAYGSATSSTASVTVGATFDGFFNTGCGVNDNPLDQTAPGSVDLHWTFPPGGNPDNNSSNAIVWSDAGPLASGGGIVPGNGASVWIGPSANIPSAGVTAGTYTFQTTFQVDETVVTSNTVITGTFGACGAAGGSTMTMALNGVQTVFTMSGNPQESIYNFSLTNGLQPGSNTLQCTAHQNGGDYCALNLGIISDTAAVLTNAPIITNGPVSVTNEYGSTVSFSAVALGAPPLSYYWLSNGVAITSPVWVGAALPYLSFVATNVATSQLVGTNFYANYQVVFSNFVGTVTSAVATLNIQIPPLALNSAGVPVWDANNNETNIVVYFSGAVDPVTGTNASNYSLNNGASVLSAALGGAPGEVILTTIVLNPATSYTLTVQNVNSSFEFPINSSSVPVGTYPTTVALWVKASQGVTTIDANNDVSQWNDLSGNGNNLLAGNPPQLVANAIDGQPMVEFNATNQTYMYASDAPSIDITGDMTVFAVVNFATLAGGTNGEILSKVNNNNEASPYDYYARSGSTLFFRGNGSTSASSGSTTGPSTGIAHILDVVMQGTNVTHRLDGNPNGIGTLSTAIVNQNQPLSIGAREDYVNFLTGGMAELILVGQALSSSDVASMEHYLATEYNLPIGVTISTVPTNILASVANNQLTLSWPKDHLGWQLQAQTNSLQVGLGTNWINVAGTTATNEVVIPINITNGSVFFRLMY